MVPPKPMYPHICRLSIVLILGLLVSIPAGAVEGGLGRPISGAQLTPFAGIIPPTPGILASVTEYYYDASISGSRNVPIAGDVAVGVDAKLSMTPITLLYVWNTGTNRWNFASAASVPIMWNEVSANVTSGPVTGQRTDRATGVFDLAFVPIVASRHFSETEHLAFNLTVWAPTGDYDSGRLANLGLNNWTVIPGAAYTRIFPGSNIELSGLWAMQFYTENPDTGYHNGILSDLEIMTVKRFPCGAGMGIVGSWIEQLTEDTGGRSGLTGGFRGRAFGVGPIITYSTMVGAHSLDFNARWIHEFENVNRLEGDLFSLSVVFKF
jgi:hypothetical protein